MLAASPVPPRKAKKHASSITSGQNIKVFVRVRPMNESEKLGKALSSVDCQSTKEVVVQERPFDKFTKKFSFDRVFDGKSKQVDIYKSVAKPLVEEVLNGFNCTIFAYGQTGTGKTFTMEGDYPEGTSIDESNGAGIIPRCVNELFDELRIQKLEFTMRVSFLELYNEELFDLLSAHDDLSKLRIYEDSSRKGSCIIQGLEEVLVRSKTDVYNIIEKGSAKRQTAATLMNAHSSRSHTVFTVTVHIKENTLDGDELLKTGKLHLVDLAGSENIGRSGAVDKRAREAGNINQSLLTLGRVITSLVEKAPHVPYRESKLTRLLQDALGGRTKTSIIATVSPASVNLEETLSTLDYAHRAKNIQNKPEVNQKLNKKELICEYTHEIEKLRRDLLAMREKNGVYLANENYQEMISSMEQQAQEISEKISQIRSLELELEKQTELFTQTTIKLEETNDKLKETESQFSKTKEVLQCTQKVLSKTALERDEQKYLVSAHAKTESELLSQGSSLIDVAKTTTSDISKLHEKLDRKRKVECMNEQVEESFSREFEERVSSMNASVHAFYEYHSRNSLSLTQELESCALRSNTLLEKQEKKLQEMNSSISNALYDAHSLFACRGQELKSKVKSHSDKVCERSAEEENLCEVFMKEVFYPLTLKMSQILIQQSDFIESLRSGINDRMSALSSHCETLREKEAALLEAIEQRLTGLVPIPSLIIEQINKKTEIMNNDTGSHCQILRKLLKELQHETDQYEERFRNHFPVLSVEEEKTLSEAESAAREALGEVNALADKSSERQQLVEREENDVKLFTNERTAKVAKDNESLGKEVKRVEEEVKEHLRRKNEAFRQVSEISTNFVEEISVWTTQAEEKSLKGTRARTEEISEKVASVKEEVSSLKEDIAKVIPCVSEGLMKSESQLEEFIDDHGDQIKESGEAVQNLLGKLLIKDVPTGQTPVRREYSYPESLPETSPHERLVNRFRNKMNTCSKIPLPAFNQEDELDASDRSCESTSCDSSLISESGTSCKSEPKDKIPIPFARSASFKENDASFAHPSNPTTRQQPSYKQNSLSRSSSASSLTDSKENVNVNARRTVSSKKRELKPPTAVNFVGSDKPGEAHGAAPSRARKVLGPFN